MRDPRGLYELIADVARCPAGCRSSPGSPGSPTPARAVAQFTEYLLDTLDTDGRGDVRHRRAARLPRPASDHLLRPGPPHRLPAAAAQPRPRARRARAAVPAAHGLRARLPVGAVHGGRARDSSSASRCRRRPGSRDPDAGAAHPADRRDGERQSRRPHRGDVDLAAAHAGAGERAAPRRVPAAGARASRRRVRAAHPALPRRHRVPAAAVTALESDQRRDRPDLPDRRAARGGAGVRRAASTSRSPRTASSRSSSARSRSATTATWRARRSARPLTDEDGELPRADEIAAELEKFLAYRRTRDDDTPLGG